MKRKKEMYFLKQDKKIKYIKSNYQHSKYNRIYL